MGKKKKSHKDIEAAQAQSLLSDSAQYSPPENIFTFARTVLQALCSKAIGTETFYAKFLFSEVTMAAILILLEEIKNEIGYEPDPITMTILTVSAYVLVVSTLFTDTASVNHIKMAEEFIPGMPKQIATDSPSRCSRYTTNAFTYINYAQFIPASIIWCLGDVIAIENFFSADNSDYLTTKQKIALATILTYFFGSTFVYTQAYAGSRLPNRVSKIAIGTTLFSVFGLLELGLLKLSFDSRIDSDFMAVLKGLLSGVSNLLGVIALWMFFSNQVKDQVADLLKRLACQESTLRNIANEPAASIELGFLISTNCILKAACAGFMSVRAANIMLDISYDDPSMLLILFVTGGWTAYNTFISRTSSVKEWLLNKKFDELTAFDFENAKVSMLDNFASVALAISHSLSVLWLINPNIIPIPGRSLKIATACLLSIGVGAHHFYVLHQKHFKEAALKIHQTRQFNEVCVVSEMSPENIFNEIQNKLISNKVKGFAKLTNLLARFNKNVLGLFVFLFTIQDILSANQIDLNLSYKDMIAWSVLLGASISETEIKSYEDAIAETVAFYLTKLHVGSATAYAGKFVSFFFYPPEKYDKNVLIRAHNKLF